MLLEQVHRNVYASWLVLTWLRRPSWRGTDEIESASRRGEEPVCVIMRAHEFVPQNGLSDGARRYAQGELLLLELVNNIAVVVVVVMPLVIGSRIVQHGPFV